MPLPQDIRPVFQDIQDTLVRSDAPWIEQSPTARMKVLWVGKETGVVWGTKPMPGPAPAAPNGSAGRPS